MPGLLRGVARTAVIAGTATAVSNRVSRRQGAALASPGAAAVRPAVRTATAVRRRHRHRRADPGVDRITALQELGELKTQGVLTEAEFAAEKARILQG